MAGPLQGYPPATELSPFADKSSVVAGDAAVHALVREFHEALHVVLGSSTPPGLVGGTLRGRAKELPATYRHIIQA